MLCLLQRIVVAAIRLGLPLLLDPIDLRALGPDSLACTQFRRPPYKVGGKNSADVRCTECKLHRDVGVTTAELVRAIDRIGVMSLDEFRSLEFELVDRYRVDESSQEALAMALIRASLSVVHSPARERIAEAMAMLQHVHDPFVTALRCG